MSGGRSSPLVSVAARVADTESGGVFNSEMATVIPQHGEGHLNWRRMIGKWFTAKRMNALRQFGHSTGTFLIFPQWWQISLSEGRLRPSIENCL